jgi:RNA recognition motif-containing protein
MNILISNLGAQVKGDDLRKLFTPFGEVETAEVAIDAFTDRSRGFGYVEMPSEEQARAAIASLHKTELEGNVITVEETAPKEVRKGSYKVGNGAVNIYRFRKN